MMSGITYLICLATAIVVLVLLFLIQESGRSRALARMDRRGTVLRQMKGRKRSLVVLKFCLLILTMTCLACALLAQQEELPASQSQLEAQEETVFAVDVSRSMLAEDVQPSRLLRTRMFLQEMLDQGLSGQVGLVVFAGRAFPYVPLTNDRRFIDQALKNLGPGLISRQGTSFADALSIASAFFTRDAKVRKNIIVISDGEDHTKNYKPIADSLRKVGIHLFCIGVGTRAGSFIPLRTEKGQVSFKTNSKGQRIVSALNERSLLEIAAEPSHYANIEDPAKCINMIRGTYVPEPSGQSGRNFWSAKVYYFLLAAFIFLLIERLVPTGLRKGMAE